MVKKITFYGVNLEEYKFFNNVKFSKDEQIEMLNYRRESVLTSEQVFSGKFNITKIENPKAKDGDSKVFYVYYDELKMSPFSNIHFYDENGMFVFSYPWNGKFEKGKPIRTSTRQDLLVKTDTSITNTYTFSFSNSNALIVESKLTNYNKIGESYNTNETELLLLDKFYEDGLSFV